MTLNFGGFCKVLSGHWTYGDGRQRHLISLNLYFNFIYLSYFFNGMPEAVIKNTKDNLNKKKQKKLTSKIII